MESAGAQEAETEEEITTEPKVPEKSENSEDTFSIEKVDITLQQEIDKNQQPTNEIEGNHNSQQIENNIEEELCLESARLEPKGKEKDLE